MSAEAISKEAHYHYEESLRLRQAADKLADKQPKRGENVMSSCSVAASSQWQGTAQEEPSRMAKTAGWLEATARWLRQQDEEEADKKKQVEESVTTMDKAFKESEHRNKELLEENTLLKEKFQEIMAKNEELKNKIAEEKEEVMREERIAYYYQGLCQELKKVNDCLTQENERLIEESNQFSVKLREANKQLRKKRRVDSGNAQCTSSSSGDAIDCKHEEDI